MGRVLGPDLHDKRRLLAFFAVCKYLGVCIISQRARFSIDVPHQPRCGLHLGGQPYCMCMVAGIRKDLGGNLVSLRCTTTGKLNYFSSETGNLLSTTEYALGRLSSPFL